MPREIKAMFGTVIVGGVALLAVGRVFGNNSLSANEATIGFLRRECSDAQKEEWCNSAISFLQEGPRSS